MRMRRKPWARPELDASPIYIKEPLANKGKWKDVFKNKNEIHLELGCGKGSFIANLASENPDINYIAVDIKSEMLGLTKRNIEREYLSKNLEMENICILAYDIERILDVFGEEDGIDRIYINFCNPWPKPRHKKKRLTHERQLEKYIKFLKKGGEIHFKTDDDGLFKDSLTYFKNLGFDIIFETYDLHKENVKNVMTEHEKMFSEEGIKIKAVNAKLR